VTVVTPIGKSELDGLLAESVTVPQLSSADGALQVIATAVSGIVLTMLSGQLYKTGLMVSLKHGFDTVTLKVHVATLFLASLAV
jgi:hypothetical protein